MAIRRFTSSWHWSHFLNTVHKLSHLFHSAPVYRGLHFLSSSFTYSHNFCLFDLFIFIPKSFAVLFSASIILCSPALLLDTVAWSSANRTVFTNNPLTFTPPSIFLKVPSISCWMYITSVYIRDDTKAAARQSPNCIKKTKKIKYGE